MSSVIPEGFEDVDCILRDGQRILVQAKERGPGGRSLGVSDVIAAVVHAAQALRTSDNELDIEARFVLITDGDLSAGIPETGWVGTIDKVLARSSMYRAWASPSSSKFGVFTARE